MAKKARAVSYEEYLEMEDTSDVRHIYWDGEVFAMSGGTLEHSALETRIVALLMNALEGRPCRPYSGNRRLRSVEQPDAAVYPDAVVICGGNLPHPEDKDATSNPAVVFEVLSDTTEAYDRGKKAAYYRSFPTLHSYVLVSQDRPLIEHFHRDGARWVLEILGPGQALTLPELGLSLSVDAIYQDVLPSAEAQGTPRQAV